MVATKRAHDQLSQEEDSSGPRPPQTADESQSKRQRKDSGIEHLLYNHYDVEKPIDFMALSDEEFNRTKPHYPILRRWQAARQKLAPGREHHLLPTIEQAADETSKDTQHPRWYLPEGDIIIRAEHVLFKVTRHELSSHSPILNKLIDRAASDVGEKIGGVPVLNSDFATAREWALMCVLFYEPKPFGKQPVLLEDVVALLELSRTLHSLFLRRVVIDTLTVEYSTMLTDYQRVTKLGRQTLRPFGFIVAIHTIHIALEYDIPQVLPMAMIDLARYSPSDIIHGRQEGGLPNRTRLRDKELVARVLLGRERLFNGRHDFTLGFLQGVPLLTDERTVRRDWHPESTFSVFCTNPPFNAKHAERKPVEEEVRLDCRTWLLYVGRDFQQNWEQVYGETETHDTISRIPRPLKDGALRDLEIPLCKTCRAKVREDMHKGIQQLWVKIPWAFGLGTWFDIATEAKKADRKLMGEPNERSIVRRRPEEVYQCPVTIPL